MERLDSRQLVQKVIHPYATEQSEQDVETTEIVFDTERSIAIYCCMWGGGMKNEFMDVRFMLISKIEKFGFSTILRKQELPISFSNLESIKQILFWDFERLMCGNLLDLR
jgi:hypothetical protein